MKAIIDAADFKRVINNTKKFTKTLSGHKAMEYIYLEIDAEAKVLKATALDGHKISIEYAKLIEADESFKCFIKPNIPKITKDDIAAELELVGNRLLVTVGDNITGYVQPDIQYFKVGELLEKNKPEDIVTSIYFNPKLLIEALQSVKVDKFSDCVRLDIPKNPNHHVIIRPVTNEVVVEKNNTKVVLPIRPPQEGSSARDSS